MMQFRGYRGIIVPVQDQLLTNVEFATRQLPKRLRALLTRSLNTLQDKCLCAR